jgi:RNA polymerase sigma-70 factor (ECF subfamily)
MRSPSIASRPMPDVQDARTIDLCGPVTPERPPAPLAAHEFDALLLSVLPSAFGYALRLTRHRADAEDLLQEAALLSCRGARTFAAGTNFKAWFFRILVRCFWSKHRTAKRRPATVDLDDTPDLYLYKCSREVGLPIEGENPASALFDRLGTERVVDAITQLPEEYGSVCSLYFMEDFAYHEIATVLGIPVGTVRSRLHRGRKMLQKALWQAARDAGIVGDLTDAPPTRSRHAETDA